MKKNVIIMSLHIVPCANSAVDCNVIVVLKNTWHIMLQTMTKKYILRILSRDDKRIRKFFQRIGLVTRPRTLCYRIRIYAVILRLYHVHVCHNEDQ
jgi:hypothetical protein